MKVHHLNCGGARPLGARLFPARFPRVMVCHVVAIETAEGLTLVDTGLSADELQRPGSLGPVGRGLGIHGEPERAAVHQLARLGFAPGDVRHIVMTHLDLDHAGGLRDFPEAEVHVSKAEHDAAMRPRSMGERLRYRPHQWQHGPRWAIHDVEAAPPGVDVVSRPLEGLPASLSLVPLFGHTRGHCGVMFSVDGAEHFHVGDTWYAEGQEDPGPSMAYRLFLRTIHVDARGAVASAASVRRYLSSPSPPQAYSSHDTAAFDRAHGLGP